MEKENLEIMVEEIREETNKIGVFIDNWIENNPYGNNLEEHNAKFRADFKAFFENSNFVHENYEDWSKTY